MLNCENLFLFTCMDVLLLNADFLVIRINFNELSILIVNFPVIFSFITFY